MDYDCVYCGAHFLWHGPLGYDDALLMGALCLCGDNPNWCHWPAVDAVADNYLSLLREVQE